MYRNIKEAYKQVKLSLMGIKYIEVSAWARILLECNLGNIYSLLISA